MKRKAGIDTCSVITVNTNSAPLTWTVIMKNSAKNWRNKAKVLMCTHPLLLKRLHGNNDCVKMESDKQNEEAEEN